MRADLSRKFLLWTLLAMLMCLPAAMPQLYAARDFSGFEYQNISGRKYYRAYDIARYYRMRLAKVKNAYELTGYQGRMVFNPQKRYGSFNNVVINYDFVPQVYKGELYISSSDFFNHVQVLLNVRSLRQIGVRTILIDPGHGGNDRGASGLRYNEKSLTLQVALRLQRILSRMGYRVLLTRVNDRRLELSDRARAANSAKVDLYISIHMNAAANRTVSGIETFCLTPPGAPSSGGEKVFYNNYPGNSALNNSMSLAWNVQGQLLRYTRAPDRGVKRARFVVLRETRCPAILIECGFISNRQEELKLGSAEYQEQLAAGIAMGIYNYHRNLRRNN